MCLLRNETQAQLLLQQPTQPPGRQQLLQHTGKLCLAVRAFESLLQAIVLYAIRLMTAAVKATLRLRQLDCHVEGATMGCELQGVPQHYRWKCTVTIAPLLNVRLQWEAARHPTALHMCADHVDQRSECAKLRLISKAVPCKQLVLTWRWKHSSTQAECGAKCYHPRLSNTTDTLHAGL